MTSSFDQSRYQVRFEYGVEGLRWLEPADVVVIVDVLDASRRAIDAAAADAELAVEDLPVDAREEIALAPASLIIIGGLRNASSVADVILAEQTRRGGRVSVAVVASASDGRVTVENQLGSGAIIDALAARGLDHASPEAAVACEGFRALRGAVRHLLTAAGSGQLLVELGLREMALAQAQIDSTDAVPVLRDGSVVRF